jgi:hypothetical protein
VFKVVVCDVTKVNVCTVRIPEITFKIQYFIVLLVTNILSELCDAL